MKKVKLKTKVKITKVETKTETKVESSIKQTEIVVVLDRSGSMRKIAAATVEGFNTFLNEQKNSEGEAFITLIQFDDRYEVDYKSIPVKDAYDLVVDETYVPRGNTALYESIGRTINELNTNRDVVFVIITDGQDNVRSEFKPEAINKMIKTLQDENGWHFLFLAANQDAVTTGGKLGVKMSNSMSYAASGAGIQNSFQSAGSNIKHYRSGKAAFLSNFSDVQINMHGSAGMQGFQGVCGPQGFQGSQGVQGVMSTLEFVPSQREAAMEEKTIVKETVKETITETTKKTN